MKKFIYIFIAIAALACILFLVPSKHQNHLWDITLASPEGHEPYDMAVFDSLLYRSLPNGYEVKHWDVADEEAEKTDKVEVPKEVIDEDEVGSDEVDDDSDEIYEDSDVYYDTSYEDYYEPDVAYAPKNEVYEYKDINKPLHLNDSLNPKKQNVLIVQRYEWNDSSGNIINTLIDALDYANKGGNVLIVREKIKLTDYFLNGLTDLLGTSYDYGQTHDYYPSGYTALDLSKSDDGESIVKTSDGEFKIHERFVPSYFVVDSYPTIYDSEDPSCVVQEMKLNMKPYLSSGKIYGLSFHNEKSGGNVYLCTLGLYFSNLGLTIPDGDKVIEYNMSKIDNKPVVRIDYDNYAGKKDSGSSDTNVILSVLAKNKALSFAWILVIVMAILVLLCGIYRKHPSKRDAHLVYVDETDPVAVREAKFRQSPLLHFIFQYSWLYKGKRNYTDLFLINYRQFARYVNRKSGVELSSADEKDIEKAYKVLALRTGIDEATIKQDLIWMQTNKLNVDNEMGIYPKDYITSQKIIEKYL